MSSLRVSPPLRSRRRIAQPRVVLLVALVGCWSAVAIARFLGQITLPGSSRSYDVLVAAMPLVLVLLWVRSQRPAGIALRYCAGWSALLASVVLVMPHAVGDQTLVIALPALTIATWLVYRWPSAGAVVVLAITGSFGSLSAYLSFHYNKTVGVILVGFMLASVTRFVIHRRSQSLRIPLAVLVTAAYLYLTIAQLLLADDHSIALAGFELAPWYLLSMLVIAYSQWSVDTHLRILRWLALIAMLVGAYATLRYIIGPSSLERNLAGEQSGFFSQYNFVNGKLKLLGSFPNGADLTAWTALMVPVCLSCALGLRGRARFAAILALPLLAIGLFGSQERAGALAALLAIIVVALLHAATRAFPTLRLGHALIAIAVTLALGTGAYLVAGSSSQNSGHSYLGLFGGSTQDASVAQHEYKWSEAFRDLRGHPFGYGLGTAPSGYQGAGGAPVQILPVTELSVDNGYLKVALEQGLAIMGIFAAALVLLAVELAWAGVSTRDPARATITLAGLGVMIALLVLEGAGAYADGVPALGGFFVVGLGLAEAARSGGEPEPA